ncbi:MAG: hypothetical protein ACTHN5_14265 [Phycisphaerae bacterium]
MKILLDESVPVQVRHAFAGHDVVTVTYLQWKGIENGDLLDAAEKAGFEALVVADKNLRYQQNLPARRIAMIELWTNHRPTLERHFSHIAQAVASVSPGAYVIVSPP